MTSGRVHLMLLLRLALAIGACWGLPLPPASGTNDAERTLVPNDTPASYANIVGLLVMIGTVVCLMTILVGCLCCHKGMFKGFENVQNGNVQDSVSSNTEFMIFPPAPCSRQARGSLVDIKFEPLPDIRPRGHGASGSHSQPRPANFSSVVNRGLSVQDWFDEPYRNFPRHQLKYLQEVGSGWFGQVVEGEGQGIAGAKKTKVVVKILREDATPTDQIYFLHEVKPFRDLNHPNVLRLLGKCVECDPFLLLFEHCAFKDLRTYLIQHRSEAESLIQENLLLRMVCNIGAGLHHMHIHGLIHTDLAARNCLVGSDLQVKIGDYGNSIEKFRDNYYCAGDIAVPIRWCAPESLRCTDTTIETKEVTADANIWSFGVVLWEVMEFGKLPYFELHDEDVLQKVIIERSMQLGRPHTSHNHRERIFQIMKLCWFEDPALRPNMEKLEVLLAHLYQHKDTSVDFEQRWNLLQPKVLRSTNIVATVEDHGTMKFENNFGGAVAAPDKWERDALHDMSPSPHPSLEFPATGEHTMSPSLQNLRGSLDDMRNPSALSDQASVSESELNGNAALVPASFAKPTLANGKVKAVSLELLQPHVEVPSSRRVQKEFDAWLISQQAKGAEASQMAKEISDAMHDLDSAFAHEKGSISSEGNSAKSTPERDVAEKNAPANGDEAESNLVSLTDSLPSDDEMWKEVILRSGVMTTPVTELVKEKSQSVQDFLKLTVIDSDNSSDSDSLPPSISKGVSMSDDAIFGRHENDSFSSKLEDLAATLVRASVLQAMKEVMERRSLAHDDPVPRCSGALNGSHGRDVDGPDAEAATTNNHHQLHASNGEGQDSALTSSTPSSCTNTVTPPPREPTVPTDESLLTFRCQTSLSSIEERASRESAPGSVDARVLTSTPVLTDKTVYFSVCESFNASCLSEDDPPSSAVHKPQMERTLSDDSLDFSGVERRLEFCDPWVSNPEGEQELTLVANGDLNAVAECDSSCSLNARSIELNGSGDADTEYFSAQCAMLSEDGRSDQRGQSSNENKQNDDGYQTYREASQSSDFVSADPSVCDNDVTLEGEENVGITCERDVGSTSDEAVQNDRHADIIPSTHNLNLDRSTFDKEASFVIGGSETTVLDSADVSSHVRTEECKLAEQDERDKDKIGESESSSSSPVMDIANSAETSPSRTEDDARLALQDSEAWTSQTRRTTCTNSQEVADERPPAWNEVGTTRDVATGSASQSTNDENFAHNHDEGVTKASHEMSVAYGHNTSSSPSVLSGFDVGSFHFLAAEDDDFAGSYAADASAALLVCSRYVPSHFALTNHKAKQILLADVESKIADLNEDCQHDGYDEGYAANDGYADRSNADASSARVKRSQESLESDTSESHQLYVESMNKLNELRSTNFKLDLERTERPCSNGMLISDVDTLSEPDVSNVDSDFCEKTLTESSFSTDADLGDDVSLLTQDCGLRSDENDFSESLSVGSYKRATLLEEENLTMPSCEVNIPADDGFASSDLSQGDQAISASVAYPMNSIVTERPNEFSHTIPDWPHENLLFLNDADDVATAERARGTSSTDSDTSTGRCLFEVEDINAALAELETDEENDDIFHEGASSSGHAEYADRFHEAINSVDSFDDEDDLLIVDTETNEALLLDSHSSRLRMNVVEELVGAKHASDVEFTDYGGSSAEYRFVDVDQDDESGFEASTSESNAAYDDIGSEQELGASSSYADLNDSDCVGEIEDEQGGEFFTQIVKSDFVVVEPVERIDSTANTLEEKAESEVASLPNPETAIRSEDDVEQPSSSQVADVANPTQTNVVLPQIIVEDADGGVSPLGHQDDDTASPKLTEKCYAPDWESESDTSSSHEASSTSGEFDCSKDHVDGMLKIRNYSYDEDSETVAPFKVSSWNKDATPTKSSFLSPQKKKKQMKKSVSFDTSDQLVIFEYPQEEKAWEEEMPTRSTWNIDSPQISMESYADWEFGEEEISEDIIEIDDPEAADDDESQALPPFYHLTTSSFYNLGSFQNDGDDDEDGADDLILYNTDQGALSFCDLLSHYGGNPFLQDGSMPDLYFSELETAYAAVSPNAAYNYQFLPYLTAGNDDGVENEYNNNNGNAAPDKPYDTSSFRYAEADDVEESTAVSDADRETSNGEDGPPKSDPHTDKGVITLHRSPRRWRNFAGATENAEVDAEDRSNSSGMLNANNGTPETLPCYSSHDNDRSTAFPSNSPTSGEFGTGHQELLI